MYIRLKESERWVSRCLIPLANALWTLGRLWVSIEEGLYSLEKLVEWSSDR